MLWDLRLNMSAYWDNNILYRLYYRIFNTNTIILSYKIFSLESYIRKYHQVNLYPKYLSTECDSSKTINKISAVIDKGKTSKDQHDWPVGFIGFACDAEFNVFAELGIFFTANSHAILYTPHFFSKFSIFGAFYCILY